jgi:hypothetical protein
MHGDQQVEPPPGVAVWETGSARMWVGPDGIFRIVGRAGSVHGAREAEDNFAALPEEVIRAAHPILADVRKVRSIDRRGRTRYRGPELNYAPAVAFLVDSPLSRAIGNIFMGLTRLPMPVRLFSSEVEAVEWLKGFIRAGRE